MEFPRAWHIPHICMPGCGTVSPASPLRYTTHGPMSVSHQYLQTRFQRVGYDPFRYQQGLSAPPAGIRPTPSRQKTRSKNALAPPATTSDVRPMAGPSGPSKVKLKNAKFRHAKLARACRRSASPFAPSRAAPHTHTHHHHHHHPPPPHCETKNKIMFAPV